MQQGASMHLLHILPHGGMGMYTTLIFWALAMYGAWTIVNQCIIRLQRQKPYASKQETYLFIAQNSESSIEGILRFGMIRTAFRTQRRQIVVIDFQSVDQTANIVKRLMAIHTCIAYRFVADQEELLALLPEICLDQRNPTYIYDLRDNEVLHRAECGLVWHLPEDSVGK